MQLIDCQEITWIADEPNYIDESGRCLNRLKRAHLSNTWHAHNIDNAKL